jgi:hypothetical protein
MDSSGEWIRLPHVQSSIAPCRHVAKCRQMATVATGLDVAKCRHIPLGYGDMATPLATPPRHSTPRAKRELPPPPDTAERAARRGLRVAGADAALEAPRHTAFRPWADAERSGGAPRVAPVEPRGGHARPRRSRRRRRARPPLLGARPRALPGEERRSRRRALKPPPTL